jgi:membrane-associated phospholipid phosphatase
VTRLRSRALSGGLCLVLCITLSSAFPPALAAQSDAPSESRSRFEKEKHLPLNILKDQVAIWTSPAQLPHMKLRPLLFVAAMGTASTVLAIKDGDIMDALGQDANRERISGYVSHVGTLPVNFGVAAGTYAIGKLSKNTYLADTGLLTLEALTDTTIITGIAKVASDRKRPIDGGDGSFLNGGHSFFSGHSSLSWTTATVLATRYPHKPWVKYPAFALATAASVSRITARKHFASDVLVGTTVGILIGRYVARKRGDELSSGVSFMPVSDLRTQTFGVRISFSSF